jgi:hypothetical protein
MIVKQIKAKQSNKAKVSVVMLVIFSEDHTGREIVFSTGDRCGITSEH